MIINGRQIAAKIYLELQTKVMQLQQKGVTPHLTVILIGEDPASISYVSQKQKWAEYIGASTSILHYPVSVTNDELQTKIQELNHNHTNHATLIQRPVPSHINIQELELLIDPQKDIDGFLENSPFTFPLALAVVKILEETNTLKKDQSIVVLGKGPTGGGPIMKHLTQLGLHPTLIDSKTPNPSDLTRNADIIISAVGKPNTLTSQNIKKGSILIGVGIARGSDGKLHGDYEEEDIKDIAALYTPTPGGVGPVNVAMLLHNLIETTKAQIRN